MLLVPLPHLAKEPAGRGAGKGSASWLRELVTITWCEILFSAQAFLYLADKKPAALLLSQRAEQQYRNQHRGLMGQNMWLLWAAL